MSDRLLFLLSKVQNALAVHFKKELKKEGLDLTTGQFAIMVALEQAKQTTMGDLSRMLEIDNSTITRLVTRLEKQQLAERRINPEDRRQMLVALTDSGREKAAILTTIAQEANRKIRDGFTEDDMAAFKKVNQGIIRTFTG